MSKCLICNEKIQDSFNNIFNDRNYLCYDCLNKFKMRNKKFLIEGCKGIVLYYYDDFFKTILFRYKGAGDYALKDVFISNYKNKIKRKYKGYKIIVAPSNESVEKRRGFCHLEEIFNCLGLEIIKCFKKEVEWKQSDKKIRERKEIQDIIKIDKSMLKGVKKVLIVDDVLTSGSTIKSMVCQIPQNIVKKVLILSSNCQFLTNEFV